MRVMMPSLHWGAFLLLFSTCTAFAAPLPWKDEKYSHFSDGEPLGEMLKTLASLQDIPIVISPKVKEVVSLHVIDRKPAEIFAELVRNYGLIWYYDKEALFVYKEDEVQTASVSMKTMSPQEFTNSLKRLEVLDERFQWEVSEVDNIIYLTGPERFVSSVLDMAKVMDTQDLSRRQIYRWKDKRGVVNFSSEDPVGHMDASWDVKTDEKFPGFDVVDVVKSKQQAE
jgi:type II secretory pathway component GspD/PulD (secretin)